MKVKRKQIDKIRRDAIVAAERMVSEKTYLKTIKKQGDTLHYHAHEAQLNYHSGEKDALYEVLSILGIDLRTMPGV